MKLIADKQFSAKRAAYDKVVPEEEATDAFWATFDAAKAALRIHFSRFGPEGTAWELPGHDQRSRVLYCYLYADAMYTPDLLPGIEAVLPKDGNPWWAELECYSDACILPNGAPLCMGFAAIIEGNLYTDPEYKKLIAYAPRLGLQVA